MAGCAGKTCGRSAPEDFEVHQPDGPGRDSHERLWTAVKRWPRLVPLSGLLVGVTNFQQAPFLETVPDKLRAKLSRARQQAVQSRSTGLGRRFAQTCGLSLVVAQSAGHKQQHIFFQ